MRSRPFDDDMAGGRAAAEADTTEQEVEDAAHEMLCEAGMLTACCGAKQLPGETLRCSVCRDDATLEVECPGCQRLVDDDDTRDHAMRCGELRARVIEDWQAEDDYREARR